MSTVVTMGPVVDVHGRRIRDLRISVTDRCNFRCVYCMPRDTYGPDHRFLAREDLLTFEEIRRLVGIATDLGVSKVRITGGEPLLRAGLDRLVGLIDDIPKVTDLAMTTNGSLLARHALRLAAAGLDRVSVSLDAIDDDVFRSLNDAGFGVAPVLEGIEAAADAGLGPVKINAVVKRGVNDRYVVDMARFFRGTGHVLRFIEYMDVGTSNGWRLDDVVPAGEIIAAIDQVFPLEPVAAAYRGEVASRYRYRDGMGEIGVITSVSRPFCDGCSRLRVSADGVVYTCLFAESGLDVRSLLRSGVEDAAIAATLESLWSRRTDRYSEVRGALTEAGGSRVEMPTIGG